MAKQATPRVGRVADIPLGSVGPDRMIPFLVAPMTFLAVLLTIVALETDNLAKRWHTDLTGRATVQIPPQGTPSADDQAIRKAVALLAQAPEIQSVAPLSTSQVDLLLSPWLGSELQSAELPVPLVIDVQYDRDTEPDFAGLSARLGEIVPGATIDDHAGALADLLEAADSLRTIAIALILIVLTTAVAVVVAIVMAGLVIHRPVIELLHVCGASDRYIANQFGVHAMWRAARGAVIGAALVLLFLPLAATWLSGFRQAFVPEFGLRVDQWIMICAVPLCMALASGLFAQIVARALLARLP